MQVPKTNYSPNAGQNRSKTILIPTQSDRVFLYHCSKGSNGSGNHWRKKKDTETIIPGPCVKVVKVSCWLLRKSHGNPPAVRHPVYAEVIVRIGVPGNKRKFTFPSVSLVTQHIQWFHSTSIRRASELDPGPDERQKALICCNFSFYCRGGE